MNPKYMDWVSFQKHMAYKLKENSSRLHVLSNLEQTKIILRCKKYTETIAKCTHPWIKQNTMTTEFHLH